MKRPGPITGIVLVIVSVLAASPLFLNAGFLNTRGGGDSPFLLFRLQQLYSAVGQGVFPVRWMPDAAYGLGYPFFSYYAALPLYAAALIKGLGASYVLSLKLTQLGGFGLAAFGLYGWLRAVGLGRLPAGLASVVYTFAPFHLVNVYVRGDSLNEFWAFGLYPLCLWAAHYLVRGEGPATRRILPLSLVYAALMFTHNISALIFTPCLGLYLALLVLRRPGLRQAPAAAAAIFLGLGLSAFFWLPALRETGYGQFGPVTQGYFNYANHFGGLNLVQPGLIFNYDVGSTNSTPFAMGLVQAAVAALAVAGLAARWLLLKHSEDGFPHWEAAFSLVCLAGATFMITPLSRPLWDNLPLLPFVQFPWRFLSVQSLFVSALAGIAAAPFCDGALPRPAMAARPLAALIGLGAAAAGFAGLRPDFVPIADADVTPERLQLYEYFTGNIGTTINYEYLPRWVYPRPYASEEFVRGSQDVSLKVLGGQASGARTAKRAASQSWQIHVESDSASLALPLLYWPGWQATADGSPLAIHPAEGGLGWVAFDLPRGDHTLELSLGDTDLRRMAGLTSLAALLIVIILARPWAAVAVVRAWPVRRWALAGGIAAGLIVVAIAGRVINGLDRPIGAASMDFDQQGYLSSSAVTFANGAVLQGYNYSASQFKPGEQLGLALRWQTGQAADYTLDLVSPAGHLLHVPYIYASVSAPAGPSSTVLMNLPADLSTGVYLLRLSLTHGGTAVPALTSAGQTRGALFLRPIRVLADRPAAAAEVPAATPLTGAVSLLADLPAVQSDASAVSITLNWLATGSAPANYALSLRLQESSGVELAALDTQPTGGIYPTSAWLKGTVVPDHYTFALPLGLPPGDYPLTITLYDAATLAPVGAVTRPVHIGLWTPPPGAAPLRRFSQTLALQDVTLPALAASGDRLSFTARWTSLAAQPTDLVARWTAVSANGRPAAVADQPLAVIPTSRWAAGALVLGRPSIQLPISAEPGPYTLNVQLLDPAGKLLSPPVAVGQVQVTAGERTTTLPPVQFKADAAFGPIHLAGYDAAVGAEALTLRLYYRAVGPIRNDYKFFVHVFNPGDESIAVQADGFPDRPTSQWQDQEVVAVTVSLPLKDLTVGAVYNMGVGWYDPASGDRLGDRYRLAQGVVRP